VNDIQPCWCSGSKNDGNPKLAVGFEGGTRGDGVTSGLNGGAAGEDARRDQDELVVNGKLRRPDGGSYSPPRYHSDSECPSRRNSFAETVGIQYNYNNSPLLFITSSNSLCRHNE